MNHTVHIYLYNTPYDVPDDLTIMGAMEYAGYRLVHESGCRNGVCGACTVLYRIGSEKKVHACLACQTLVAEGMHVAVFPDFPIKKAIYDIDKIKPDAQIIKQLYPEIYDCRRCGLCDTMCPKGLSVMAFVDSAARGDFAACAELSFGCVMCNACAYRCPAGITQPQAALLARRLNGKYLLPEDEALNLLIDEIHKGEVREQMDHLAEKPMDELRFLYQNRDISSRGKK